MRAFPRHQQLATVLGISCVAFVAAMLLRGIVDPVIPFTAAVLASSWFFGLQGGLAALAVCGTFALIFTVPPTQAGVLGFAAFVVLNTILTVLISRSQERAYRFRSMLGSIGDAVIATNKDSLIRYMNEQAEGLLGVPLEKACDRPLHEIAKFRDQKSGKWVELPIEAVLKNHVPVASQPQRLVLTRAGAEVEVEQLMTPLRNQDGDVVGLILTIRDTTRRREAEDQLSRSQKMDAIARLAGGIAGDFNNLLCVITGFGEMLCGELAPTNPLRHFSEEILYAADRAAAVTRQLMAFSRHQSGQSRLLDVNASLSGMETMLRRLLGDRFELVIFTGPGVGKIKADPGQIEQVIVNLAMNARDAMAEGGKFMIETSPIELSPSTPAKPDSLAPGNYILLTVSDTGAGMDADTRSRLFEPFFTTKGQGKSTGLGLSIVYGIVRQAGGDISVFSQPGAGTIFEIYLPKAKEQEAPAATLRGRGPRGTETILVADDDDGVRKLVHAVLATRGYSVVEAIDGKEALTAFQAGPDKFDLVLTDVVMPNLNGFQLGDQIVEMKPEQKVLYMSGFRDNPIMGAEHERQRLFLHKPFTPDALLAKVRDVLDGKISARA